MTNLTIARAAGSLALALTLAAAALPAEASSLKPHLSIQIGSGSGLYDYDRHDDCLSRREIKYEFAEYGLKHIDVRSTHDYGLFLVSGYKSALKETLLRESDMGSKKDYVRYVYLFDACDDHVVKQLQPKKVEVM